MFADERMRHALHGFIAPIFPLATPPPIPYTAPSSDSGPSGFAGFTLIHQVNGDPSTGAVW